METLNNDVIPRALASSGHRVLLIGYADGTNMTDDCRRLYNNGKQEGLSKARAESVKEYLVKRGIDAGRIDIKAEGIRYYPYGRIRQPEDRCVVVKFVR
jgi:outer membrane protein OmpA-like peptidoglycan-associated protein